MNAPLKIKTADLFCGGGGWTEGLKHAAQKLNLDIDTHICVNHWGPAINTHSSNHPYATHICDQLNKINPSKYGKLDVVIASPECTHFSNARGAAPVNDQKRIPAGSVPGWIEQCQPEFFAIENVREFAQWGEMGEDDKPKKDGKMFRANVVDPLRCLGYSVEWKVLNCADFGDPTTRQRLFILGRRDGKPVIWPKPTHAKAVASGLKGWVPARDIIDWSIKSKSIFDRKTPLAKNTIARIEAGIRKFWGPWAGPFLIVLKGTTSAHVQASAKHLADPLPALCAGGTHMGLVEPLLVGQQSCSAARPTTQPMMTCAAAGAIGLCEPFLTIMRGKSSHRGIGAPAPTLTTGQHLGLVCPFLVEQSFRGAGDQLVRSVDRPSPTLLTKQHVCLCEPFLVKYHGEKNGSIDRSHGTGEPLKTLDCSNRYGLCEPFLVEYHGTGKPHTLDNPTITLTTRDRLGLVQQLGLDIHYRMLQPKELAAATGFPASYLWYGNKTQIVRQIGNAVPVNTAQAILECMLRQTVIQGDNR